MGAQDSVFVTDTLSSQSSGSWTTPVKCCIMPRSLIQHLLAVTDLEALNGSDAASLDVSVFQVCSPTKQTLFQNA